MGCIVRPDQARILHADVYYKEIESSGQRRRGAHGAVRDQNNDS